MSKLSILCALNLIASFTSAVLGGVREEDLKLMGYTCNSLAMRVTKISSYEHPFIDPYTEPFVKLSVEAVAVPVPEKIENSLVLGSPMCSMTTFLDGLRYITGTFTSSGECVLTDGKQFVQLLSNIFYVPHSDNQIVFQVYDKDNSSLLKDFVSRLQSKSPTLQSKSPTSQSQPTHIISWRLFNGQERVQLRHAGALWIPAPIYADVSHVNITNQQPAVLNYAPPRGISLEQILQSKLGQDGQLSLTGDAQGNFVAGFDGFRDGQAGNCFILDAALSRMPPQPALDVRTNALIHATMILFNEDLLKVKDYRGILSESPAYLTLVKVEKEKSRRAYDEVYSVVWNLSKNKLGTIIAKEDILKKLGDKE